MSMNDHALCRYTVEDEWPGGLWCGGCGAEIVEASEDYCTAHDAWRVEPPEWWVGPPYCDYVRDPQEEAVECQFPDTVDPNPPVPRWVPCGSCGARDGERHREGCSAING